jgi:hypothetical protein
MAEDITKALGKDNPEDTDTSKAKEDSSKESKDKKTAKTKDISGLNEDILSQMLMTGNNESGMFEPDEKELEDDLAPNEELHEEQDDKAKLGKIKDIETKEEYKKAMIEDMGKHPEKYSIETPQGRMSVAEAIRKGFNPETKQFEKSLDEKNEEALSRLNDEDRAAVEQFIDPSKLGLAPADADAFGIPQGNAMRKPMEPTMQPMHGAAPVQQMPQGAPVAPAPTAMAPQQGTAAEANILSMLGGM